MDNKINKPVSNQFSAPPLPKHTDLGKSSNGAKFGQALVGGAVQVAGQVVNTVAGGNVLGLGPLAGVGGEIGGTQDDMVGQMREENTRMLQLQNQMQQQSAFFNTMSNIAKTDHDTRMNAIRNIKG